MLGAFGVSKGTCLYSFFNESLGNGNLTGHMKFVGDGQHAREEVICISNSKGKDSSWIIFDRSRNEAFGDARMLVLNNVIVLCGIGHNAAIV